MTPQDDIKEKIQDLLEHMGIPCTIAIEDRSGQLVYNIKSDDSRILIGQYGGHLKSLQHIARLLVRRSMPDGEQAPEFYLDVEDYRRNRDEFLQALAGQAADRVRQTQQRLVLKPMGSSDRRVIHTVLAQSPDLITESIGEEPERRIVIKLKK
ncbi:MAG: hypothetical protein A2722_04280 [Candidatus Doudnabacteria bacterium RIFCSPHIGHO2_01_FULL_50_11]|uniref:R3H domain-containing protein n=1 Tax=Candidatus Doudnabacteria bacterium RIFCSPHIGHO2_01_FULL_50_11 TaxID=1817828 RepID=A0A1F5PG57_9BACT|nr:MAG: hypothetical protein A2722_04280 [Candidatus Doudnabacteria bacterium RIFCSPHIGHO2_01_FULL_50_11]